MHKLIYVIGILASVVTIVVLTACPPADAQTMRKIEIDDKEGVAMLPEIGAIITSEEGKLKVIVVSPAEARPAAYKSVDLQEGDIVAMANGKRMARPLDLDSLYKAAKIGDAIKLGIKRGEQMMIVSFVKADEKDLPKRQTRVVGGPGGEVREFNTSHKFEPPKGVENVTALVPAAIMIGEKKGKVVVAGEIGLRETDPRTKEFKADDILISLNNQPITTAASAEDALSKVANGQDVQVVIERNGKQQTITFTKKATGAVIKMDRK